MAEEQEAIKRQQEKNAAANPLNELRIYLNQQKIGCADRIMKVVEETYDFNID